MSLATSASSNDFPHLQNLAIVDGITYVRPAAGWDQRAPGGWLMLAMESTYTRGKEPKFYTGSSTYSKSQQMMFGLAGAQRLLRGVFDTLCVRDLSEAEARDAFLAGQ